MSSRRQQIGTAATIAIVLALGSFVLTCTGHPLWGLIAGILSLPSGGLGFVAAASPRRRGGLISLSAIGLGLLAIAIATLGLLGMLAGWVL